MYVFIPGAGGAAWYWHRVLALLDGPAVAVDLPSPDPDAGLTAYMDLVVEAAADAPSVVLVAQSMGAFTAVPCVERLPVERLVLLNAMVPAPGETANDWWRNAGHEFPEDFDVDRHFFHDLAPDVVAGLMEHGGDEAEAAFSEPCAFERWPDVPTTVLAGRDDRFFPFEFQARVARERLGLDVVPVPGGHLAALSQPEAIAAALVAQ